MNVDLSRAQHVAPAADVPSILKEGLRPDSGWIQAYGRASYLGFYGDIHSAMYYGRQGRNRTHETAKVVVGSLTLENPYRLEIEGCSYENVRNTIIKDLGGYAKVSRLLQQYPAAQLADSEDDSPWKQRWSDLDFYCAEAVRDAFRSKGEEVLTALLRLLGFDAMVLVTSQFHSGLGGAQIVLFDPPKFKPEKAVPLRKFVAAHMKSKTAFRYSHEDYDYLDI